MALDSGAVETVGRFQQYDTRQEAEHAAERAAAAGLDYRPDTSSR